MCLAVPGKVLEIWDKDETRMASVDFGGVVKEVCLEFVPDIEVGEYTIVHVGFARLARERGWLRLWRADLDGRPAAYWLGYLYRGEYWSFQIARDPAHADDSIGFVLLMHAIRCAFGERAVRFHHLSGAFEYKLRIADEDAGKEMVLVAGRTLATPLRLGYAAAHRLPDPVRGALRRRLFAHLIHTPGTTKS